MPDFYGRKKRKACLFEETVFYALQTIRFLVLYIYFVHTTVLLAYVAVL